MDPFALQILGAVRQHASVVRAAMTQCTAEREGFEAAWQKWMNKQCATAIAQPLPKVCVSLVFECFAPNGGSGLLAYQLVVGCNPLGCATKLCLL